jgi:hypothetical protein
VRETTRIYRRFQEEFVESLAVCPWAERARVDGRVRIEVVLEPALRVSAAVETGAALAADPQVEIGLLIYPWATVGREAFEVFVADVRQADAKHHHRAGVPMAMAAFHPHAASDLASPARLVPFLRRSPDPTIQLVRRSALDHVRRGHAHGTGFVDPQMLTPELLFAKPKRALHERVALANHQRVEAEGVESYERVLADIQRDRDETYARLRASP